MKPTLLTAILFFTLNYISFSQAGILDSSFGTNGKVTTNIGLNTPDYSNSLVVQPDDKVIISGSIDYGATQTWTNFAIVRYFPNGGLDSSFGVNGKVITDESSMGNKCYAVGLQPDGKIIAAGNYLNVSTAPSNYEILIVRYKANGEIDSTFGINGKATINIPEYNDFLYSLAIQKDGKIVVGGKQDGQDSLTGQGFEYSELMRFNANGIIDSTFGDKGILIATRVDFSSITALHIQPDNKIIACGNGNGPHGSNDFALARYLPNGELDFSFGTNGIVTTDLTQKDSGDADDITHSLDLQADGKIVVVGETLNTSTKPSRILIVARYNSNGKLDKSFNKTGIVKGNFYNEISSGNAIAIEKDNKIVVSGFAIDSARASFLVARYKDNGVADSTFGMNGFTITHFGNDIIESTGVGFQSDGKIIVGGTDYYSYNGDFALARYNNDAVLPVNLTSFTATKNNQSVLLNWNTCNEVNNKGFYVQRNTKINVWTDIGYIAAQGIDKGCNDYSFTDSKPLSGNNFYRLKQIDNDGKISYSKIINIIFEHSSITLSPNPAKNIFTIKGLGNNTSVLYITDASGKSVSSNQTSNDTFNWNIQNVSAGNYFIAVYQNNKLITSIKFIKQ